MLMSRLKEITNFLSQLHASKSDYSTEKTQYQVKGSDESPKETQRIHKGTQRMLKEPQNNVISYSKWKILTKTRIFK